MCTLTIPSPHPPPTIQTPSSLGLLALLLIRALDLHDRKLKRLADPALHGRPVSELFGHVPRQEADPGLDIVVETEGDVVELGDLAGGMGDLVFWALVAEFEEAAFGKLV